MPHKLIVIRTDGTREVTEHARRPDLVALQKAVGGYIETVPHMNSLEHEGVVLERVTAFCNEYGLINNLPYNREATKEWLRCLGPGPFRYTPVLRGDVAFVVKCK